MKPKLSREGRGWDGEVCGAGHAQRVPERDHEEDKEWIKDPSGHYHPRQSGNAVSAFSLVMNKKNGNQVKKEKRALRRREQGG